MSGANLTTLSPVDPYTKPSHIATLIIGILAIITNGILITVTLLDPLKRFRHSSIYFIISLAVSDFLTGIASSLFALRKSFEQYEVVQDLIFAFNWISIQNSFMTIFLMSVERLMIIKDPLKARYVITKRRTKLAIVFTWISSFLVGVCSQWPKSEKLYAQFVILIECCVIVVMMMLVYLRLLCLLRNSTKLFRGKNFKRSTSSQGKKDRTSRHNRNLTLVVFYLALVLIVTVLPHLIIGHVYVGYALFHPNSQKPASLQIAPHITFPIELINFVVNPLIYAWRLPEYRQALCYYFRKAGGRHTAGSGSFTTRTAEISRRRCYTDAATSV